MVSPQTRTRAVRKVFMARIILAPNENHSGAPRRRHRDRGGRGHVRAPGGGLRPREDPHAAADHGAGVAGARGDEAPVPRGRRRALRRRRPRDHARGRLAALGDGRLGRRAAGEVLRRHALAPRRSRRDRSRRHPRELRGHVPRPRGQPGGAGPRAAGPARPLRPRPRAARRRAHRALRVRAGAAAQAARARRQDHVRDEVERPVPPGRRGNRPDDPPRGVVVCMNQYGDILSDVAGEVAGGLGVAPSANFGDNGWAYFESLHGSAPDIAGRGIANPTGTLLSAALMLEHLGLAAEAERLQAAVARVYRDGKALTPDQRGTATTKEMAGAVLAAYRDS